MPILWFSSREELHAQFARVHQFVVSESLLGHSSFQTDLAVLWAGRAVLGDHRTLPEILVQDEPLHRRVAFQQLGLREDRFLFLGKETEAPRGGLWTKSSCRTEQLLGPLFSCPMLVHRFLWVLPLFCHKLTSR